MDNTFVFPGKMSQKQIDQFLPETILVSSTNCFLRKDALDFKKKLEKSSKLLQFLDFNGAYHGFYLSDGNEDTKSLNHELRGMVSKYLLTSNNNE